MIKCECGFYDRDRPHSAVGGGNCDHVTRRKLGKQCSCLDYCERNDPHSSNPAGACRMPSSGDIHTCSYHCNRPECIKAQRDELRDSLAAAEADAGRLDWLEEKPYWVTVQSQPSGEFIHSGSGHGIRAALQAATQNQKGGKT